MWSDEQGGYSTTSNRTLLGQKININGEANQYNLGVETMGYLTEFMLSSSGAKRIGNFKVVMIKS